MKIPLKVLLKIVLVPAVLIALSSVCLAQRWPVQIVHVGTDTIGQRVAYQIKEIIQNSATMGPYTGSESGWFKIRLTTTSIVIEQQSLASCFATILTMCIADAEKKVLHSEEYIQHWVGVCNTQGVRETAEGIVAGVSKQFDKIRAGGK